MFGFRAVIHINIRFAALAVISVLADIMLWSSFPVAYCNAKVAQVVQNEYAAGNDWPYYNGTAGGTHYSRLKDINVTNVSGLKIAWKYDTGEELQAGFTMESNPLIVRGHLFFVSPKGRLICLDGANGRQLWTFEPDNFNQADFVHWVRGVSYWTDGRDRRIFFAFARNLYALDADTGRLADEFGTNGRVELAMANSDGTTTPGAVYKNLIIVGGKGSIIQAFDVHSGKERWIFHTVPGPGQTGYETWPTDVWKKPMGANDWAGMTLDEARGLVFLPLSEPLDWVYGGHRAGDNLFSDSLVALDSNTGRLVWYFQTVRHDLWDRDLPAPPTLVTVTHDGKRVDALALVTKTGFIYLLDRLTGKSLAPLLKRKAFATRISGEVISPIQIEPKWPAPFARQHLTEDLLTHRTAEARTAVLAQFRGLISRGPWDPPSEQGTIVLPGLDGGAEWGGAAYDPETGLLYVNSNEMAWILKLRKHVLSSSGSGSALYRENCASCHGEDRAGHPPFPSLIGITKRLSAKAIEAQIIGGGGRMPAFEFLGNKRITALITYLRTGVDEPTSNKSQVPTSRSAAEVVYALEDVPKFLDPDGYPAIEPPWGTLNGVNLNTGRYAWRIPFGEFPELVAKGIRNTGSENYGGPIVTAGGLLFIGATSFDRKFHAYDKRTGKLLWQAKLPAAGIATPATFRANGRQFVVIAAGGGRPENSKPGSQIVAFALPARNENRLPHASPK